MVLLEGERVWPSRTSLRAPTQGAIDAPTDDNRNRHTTFIWSTRTLALVVWTDSSSQCLSLQTKFLWAATPPTASTTASRRGALARAASTRSKSPTWSSSTWKTRSHHWSKPKWRYQQKKQSQWKTQTQTQMNTRIVSKKWRWTGYRYKRTTFATRSA